MKKVDFDKFDNSWYKPGSFLKRIFWYFFSLIFINTAFPWPMSLKKNILKIFGTKIGRKFVIKPSVNIKYPWFLEISDNVWIGEKVWIDNFVMVKIGINCCISQGALLLTGNHDYKKVSFDLIPGEITMEEGAWAGAKTVICPGVIMKSHSILTVGSIATKNLEENGIYVGNPALKIRNREILD
ncbi:MAG: colanic acid biosynthesis acetyltransferase WcaF [Cytophagaceae bacterium]|nr:colanic acid biosynthesis acetyltransferase WcaF [Cytophagaceae bacterium]